MNTTRILKKRTTQSKSAFTLMEVLVVLGIIGMIALIAVNITPSSVRDQASYEATVEIMDRIEQALLGVPPTHLEGERRYMGYIADMGELPELLGENNQPGGLWTNLLVSLYGTEKDLPLWQYTGDTTRIWVGWHGPYLEAPTGALRDGWGNALVFERFDISDEGTEVSSPEGRNLRFKSLGSDGTLQDPEDTGTGYEADIERVIRAQDYLGSLAGYKDRDILSVEVYYPSKGELKSVILNPEDDDNYFCTGSSLFLPMGTRSLRTTGESEKTILFSLEPTANFLGTIR